jgi:hypothetical protein
MTATIGATDLPQLGLAELLGSSAWRRWPGDKAAIPSVPNSLPGPREPDNRDFIQQRSSSTAGA